MAAGSCAFYAYLQPIALAVGLAYGRIEATEVRIGSKIAGRVAETRHEGDRMKHGDEMKMDDSQSPQWAVAHANIVG